MPQPVITSQPSAPTVEFFTFATPLRLLWRRRYVVAGVAIALLALVAGNALVGPGTFTANMTVASIGRTDTSVLNQITPAGMQTRFAGKDDREFSEFQTILRSFALAERLERKYGLVRVLFGSSWNAQAERWEPPQGWRHDISVVLNRLRGRPDWLPPNVYDLAENFAAQVKLVQAKHSSTIYEISYTRPERDQAVYVLEKLYAEAEIMLREERLRRAQEQVAYLRQKIAETPIPEYRKALTELLADQEKQLMLLASDLPVATLVLDPPNTPREPSYPNVVIAAAIGAAAGCVLGMIAVLLGGMIRFGVGALRHGKAEIARPA